MSCSCRAIWSTRYDVAFVNSYLDPDAESGSGEAGNGGVVVVLICMILVWTRDLVFVGMGWLLGGSELANGAAWKQWLTGMMVGNVELLEAATTHS